MKVGNFEVKNVHFVVFCKHVEARMTTMLLIGPWLKMHYFPAITRNSKWASLTLGVLGQRKKGKRFRTKWDLERNVGRVLWVQGRLLSRAAPDSVHVPWPTRLTLHV